MDAGPAPMASADLRRLQRKACCRTRPPRKTAWRFDVTPTVDLVFD